MWLIAVCLLIVSFESSVVAQQYDSEVQWQDMIVTPANDISYKPDKAKLAAQTLQNPELQQSEPVLSNIPNYTAAIISGFTVPPPIAKGACKFSLGLSIQWFKGLNFELLGVFPAHLQLSAAWLLKLRDDALYKSNAALYVGMSMFSRGGDIFAGLVNPKAYSPTFGFRLYSRRDKDFSGILLDNRYELVLDGSGNLRILLLLGYFFPL